MDVLSQKELRITVCDLHSGNKLHSIGVREEFKAHKDYEKYKRS